MDTKSRFVFCLYGCAGLCFDAIVSISSFLRRLMPPLRSSILLSRNDPINRRDPVRWNVILFNLPVLLLPLPNHETCFSISDLSSSVICPDFNAFEREFAAYSDLIRWNLPSSVVGAFRGFARFFAFLLVTSIRVAPVLLNFLSAGILTEEQNARDGIRTQELFQN